MRPLSKFSFAVMFAAVASVAWAQNAPTTTVIHAGHLIAEPGKPPLTNRSVIVEDGKVVAVKEGFVAGDNVVDLKDAWVMPGLIDMHTHLTGVLDLAAPTEPQIAMAYMRPPAEAVLSMLPRAKALLMSGFTTIRSLGDQSSTQYALRDAINKGLVVGPRMFVSEPQISVDGGDLDASRWDVRKDLEQYVSNRGNCTGVTECIKVVRQEVRRGADVVKLRQSGLPFDAPKVQMVESQAEVQAIIDTAHQLDRKVAAHVIGSPAYLHMVIAAGADTIEHGPVDDAAIALMKKHGTAYTPTLLAGKMIDFRFQEGLEGVGKAYRAGVPIIFGTDLGIFDVEQSHVEFGLLAQAGMPPEQVLRAATVNAANALGRGDSLGMIAPGMIADIIATKRDPLTKIDALGDAGEISFVMKEGQIFKDAR
ncbi:amidohydrolase family protein [Peristeroidobacter soli]|uniref:amidohydrolase family protein n=1 Tax=Peristeroidobacter soli TaxID=2497877 RepID=UPI00101C3A6B|nr:amidohydrolase family protein [Peristeroidobacter soli]